MSDVTSIWAGRDLGTNAADLSVLEATRLLRAGAVSAVELTEACLRRIDERNGNPPTPTFDGAPEKINAWARIYDDVKDGMVLLGHTHTHEFERGLGYERGHPAGPGDPLIALTALWDMTGMPVVSLPVSWCVGVSLVAPRGHEAPLIQAAIDLQEHALGIPVWR